MFGSKKSTPTDLAVYMHPAELAQVVAVLEAIAPARCLEWGSGGSTRAILQRSPFIQRYVSVEHNADWHAQVARSIDDPRLSLHLVQPDQPVAKGAKKQDIQAWDLLAETDRSLMRSYVAFPSSLGLTFDFVLVDGRARTFCMQEGFRLLAPGGVMILHDAQRTEYHAAARALGRATFLEPWHQGQVCLLRKA